MVLRFGHSRCAGFTLIEIMIVIAIIVILAGIMVPHFAQARAEAQLVACRKNCEAIGHVFEAFLIRHSEHNLRVMIGTDGGGSGQALISLESISHYNPAQYRYSVPIDGLEDVMDLRCPAKASSLYYINYGACRLDYGQESSDIGDAFVVSCGRTGPDGALKRGRSYSHKMPDGTCIAPRYIIGSGCYDWKYKE